MDVSRRQAIRMLAAGGAAGLLGAGWSAETEKNVVQARSARILRVNLLGYTLAIHVPSLAALLDVLPATAGYGVPQYRRFSKTRTLTETLVAGAAEIGEADPIGSLRAVEAGADLKFIGNFYMSSDLVFVANADRIREYKDLEKPGVTVAVNSKGDITYVLLVGPLLRHGVDLKKITVIEIGGSGARMRALLSKRVDAVPIHLDQLAQVQKQGNFRVLLEPWREYPAWINEVWAVNGAWLRKAENQRAAVDLMKAVIIAFRRANHDLPWYTEEYRKHVTLHNAKDATQDQLRSGWRALAQTVKAWPPSSDFAVKNFQDLLPVYKAAGAIAGTVKVEQVVDTSYVQQALKELGG